MLILQPPKYRYFFTVFTPTYNRDSTLHRVYNSLCRQTFRDFEWLIVDDGSTDNTADLISTWVNDANFCVRYYWQKNQGKHVAINRGVNLAQGQFFLIADSDDAFVEKTLHVFHRNGEHLSARQKAIFLGVSCLVRNGHTGKIIGGRPNDFPTTFTYELPFNIKHRRYYETWSTSRTEILKKYPFPEIENIKFIPEGIVWNKICRRFKRIITDEVLRIAYYRKDGFSRNVRVNYYRHAHGFYLYFLTNLNEHSDLYLKYDQTRLLKDIIQLGRVGTHAGIPFKVTLQKLAKTTLRLLFLLCSPVSILLAISDRNRRNMIIPQSFTP